MPGGLGALQAACISGDCRNGQGVYRFPDGAQYSGSFREGRKHGDGTYTFAEGGRYEGEFVTDRKHGQGVFVSANGDRYEGAFENDQRHGLGTYTYAGGDQYRGQFVRGLMEGSGGRNNAYTSSDVTVYQDWFPRSALELVFDLEADRMRNLDFDPKAVESERGVVYSERRSSVDNDNVKIGYSKVFHGSLSTNNPFTGITAATQAIYDAHHTAFNVEPDVSDATHYLNNISSSERKNTIDVNADYTWWA